MESLSCGKWVIMEGFELKERWWKLHFLHSGLATERWKAWCSPQAQALGGQGLNSYSHSEIDVRAKTLRIINFFWFQIYTEPCALCCNKSGTKGLPVPWAHVTKMTGMTRKRENKWLQLWLQKTVVTEDSWLLGIYYMIYNNATMSKCKQKRLSVLQDTLSCASQQMMLCCWSVRWSRSKRLSSLHCTKQWASRQSRKQEKGSIFGLRCFQISPSGITDAWLQISDRLLTDTHLEAFKKFITSPPYLFLPFLLLI